jgi:hypothetical protein
MITTTNFHETYEIYATGRLFYRRKEHDSFVAWKTRIHRPAYPVTAAVLSTQKKEKETLCSTSIKIFLVLLLLTARKSWHKFQDESEERRHLIHNYPVTYTGENTEYQQCYAFEI